MKALPRATVYVLTLTAMLLPCGCRQKDGDPSDDSSAAPEKQVVIGISLMNLSNEYIVLLNDAMEAKARGRPVEAQSYMIVAAKPYAVEAGVTVLAAGGTAADALFAVQLVLGLCAEDNRHGPNDSLTPSPEREQPEEPDRTEPQASDGECFG